MDFPPGVFSLKQSLVVPENVQAISGHHTKIVLQKEGLSGFLMTGRTANLTVSNLEFEGPSKSAAFEIFDASNIVLRDCTVSGSVLLKTGRERKISRNITISGMICKGVGDGFCIDLAHVRKATVTGNTIENYAHGIMWWGGDSAKVPVDSDPDYGSQQLFISLNNVRKIGGAGIWGSMGSDIIIEKNTVDGAGDVGIDLEGCKNATVRGNTVFDAKNGGLSIFFFSRNIHFINNTVTSRNPAFPVFRSYNKSQRAEAHPSVVFEGNHFLAIGGIGTFDDSNGPMKGPVISGNTFENVRIRLKTNNASSPTIEDNQITLTEVMKGPGAALEVRGFNGTSRLQNNRIQNTAAATGTVGILVSDDDYNHANTYELRDNFIQGFEKDIVIRTDGKNKGNFPMVFVENNILAGNIVEQEGEGKRKCVISGNKKIPKKGTDISKP